MIQVTNCCCFTGHRKIDPAKAAMLKKRLTIELGWMTSHGVPSFFAGGALGFDTLAALTVLEYRRVCPDVQLHLMLPCPEQCRFWKQDDIDIYNYILAHADSHRYLSDHYHNGVMQMRNRAMVDESAYCISYYDRDIASPDKTGGTLYTLNYARKMGRKLINLCDDPPDDLAF